MVAVILPSGREIRMVGARYEGQPPHDNYWVSAETIGEVAAKAGLVAQGDVIARVLPTDGDENLATEWCEMVRTLLGTHATACEVNDGRCDGACLLRQMDRHDLRQYGLRRDGDQWIVTDAARFGKALEYFAADDSRRWA